jgi:hypothetical protein
VIRELAEEIGCTIAPDRFEPLASYEGPDNEGGPGTLKAAFYVVRAVEAANLIVTEGALFATELDRLADLDDKLTPAAHFAIAKLRNSGNGHRP